MYLNLKGQNLKDRIFIDENLSNALVVLKTTVIHHLYRLVVFYNSVLFERKILTKFSF
jgi:hypothetical protein